MSDTKGETMTKLEPYYAILFEDADRPPELFARREDASARYNLLRGNWNCHLFVQSNPPPYPEQDEHEQAMAFVKKYPTGEPWKAELELASMLADRRSAPTPTATPENIRELKPTDREIIEECLNKTLTDFTVSRDVKNRTVDNVHELLYRVRRSAPAPTASETISDTDKARAKSFAQWLDGNHALRPVDIEFNLSVEFARVRNGSHPIAEPTASDREAAAVDIDFARCALDGLNLVDERTVRSVAFALAAVRADATERCAKVLQILLDDLRIGEEYDVPGGMKVTCHPPLSRMIPSHRNHIRRLIKDAIRGAK